MNTPSTSTNTTQKPKIDPLQLLKCLSILLNPRGGIRGETEVQRVKGLMAKYSKKLVSKCIYLNILQATDLPLLDLFYEEGGWELVGVWLQEAVNAKNWPLATQVLNLLETSPMTVARLKRNTTPKLVKELSKDSSNLGVQLVAKHLVLKWMEVVRQGDGVATAAGVGLANSSINSADEDSVDAPALQAETPKEKLAVDGNGEGEAEDVASDGAQTATAYSSQGEGGDGSSSLSCQDESSNTSTESDNTPAPTTPIRITIRSGSQVLAKVSSQRLSQDSTDSDDNKPLSVIKQEVEKARYSPSYASTPVNQQDSRKSAAAGGAASAGDDTRVTSAAGSLEAGDSALDKSQIPVCVSVSSAAISTAAPTSITTTTTTTLTTTVPLQTESTSITKAPAVHTIVTFTGSLAATTIPVATPGSNIPPQPPDTKAQSCAETEGKSDVVNGVSSDTKVEDAKILSKDEVDTNDKLEEKSEVKSDMKGEKDKKSGYSKDKDGSKDKNREKEKDRDKDKKSRESDKRKDRNNSKSSKSSSSSKPDRDRDKSSKNHEKSRNDKHRSSSSSSKSSSRDRDRKDKDRGRSSKDKKSSSRDKEKQKEKDRDKDKEKHEDKKKKEQENEDKATLEKVKPLSVDGLAKIPRKPTPASFLDALGSADVDMQESKKPSVKTYKSRGFRNTGLLDEPTKLPGVAGKKASEKKPSSGGVSLASGMKRPPTLDDLASVPPDKRVRSSVSSLPLNADKPGGVKLISPKRPSLSDDGGFMAALTAAGPETRKKVTRKRKSSESDPKDPKSEAKDEDKKEEDGSSPTSSPVKAEDKSVMLSPTSVRPTFNFYQETLKDDEEEVKVRAEGEEAEKTEEEEVPEKKEGEEGNEESTQPSESQDGDVEMKEEVEEDNLSSTQMEVEESETKESSFEPGGGDGDGGDAAVRDEDIPHAPAVPAPAQEEYEKVEVTFSSPNPESIRSVLVYHRPINRKKKTVKWKTEDDLKEVFFFELDETERVNVNTIKFNELMVMEKQREREAMGKSRALHGHMGALGGGMNSIMGDDIMMGGMGMHPGHSNVREFMRWSLLPVMLTGQPNITPGCRSQERVIQATRESSTMAAFFHPAMLPDTPREPDPELVIRSEPKEIPLHDVSGQDNIHDHRTKLWPEPVINDPINYGYGGGGMGNMSSVGGLSPSSSGGSGGGSHWVIGGPPSGGYGAGPMYGGHGGPGGPSGPSGYGGPGHGSYGGDMGGGMDGPGWGGPGPDYPGQNMMMGSGGGQGMMMGPRPNMGPRGMMPNVGMGGGGGPRFRGRGGGWGPRGSPPPCKHFMNGHCRHGKNCKFLHAKQY